MRPHLDVRTRAFVAQIAAALLACAAAAAVVSACADDATTDAPPSDGGLDDRAVATAICPARAPESGSRCVLPEGTTCDFGQCGKLLARCTTGFWRFGANADARPPCPAQPPEIASQCPECWPVETTCIYGSQDCSAEDASVNTSIASCVDRRWALEVRACRDAGDAGADVQGDAEADAD